MKSKIKEELDEVLRVLDQLSTTYNDMSTDVFKDGVNTDEIKNTISACHKTKQVSGHLYTVVKRSYFELESWLRNMSIRYENTTKYDDMDERLSSLDSAMDNVHELTIMSLPKVDDVPIEGKEELEDFVSEFSQSLWDLSTHTEEAIEEIRNVQLNSA